MTEIMEVPPPPGLVATITAEKLDKALGLTGLELPFVGALVLGDGSPAVAVGPIPVSQADRLAEWIAEHS